MLGTFIPLFGNSVDLGPRSKKSLISSGNYILGYIDGTFGTSGKIKVYNSDGFSEALRDQYRDVPKNFDKISR